MVYKLNNSSYPISWVMGCRGVMMESLLIAVLHCFLSPVTSTGREILHPCPLCNIIIVEFSPTFFSPSTLICSVKDYLGENVKIYYVSKPG